MQRLCQVVLVHHLYLGFGYVKGRKAFCDKYLKLMLCHLEFNVAASLRIIRLSSSFVKVLHFAFCRCLRSVADLSSVHITETSPY